eukprot:Hpha_TRINITY_DN16881_c2_g1::TRINITY_DN16881_c2_g1_i4::g.149452::m.149452
MMWRAVVCSSLLGAAVAQNYCDPASCPTETPTVWYGCVTPTVALSKAPTQPITPPPSTSPVTSSPSTSPVTSSPSTSPSTRAPTTANQAPSLSPTSPTVSPSVSPSTSTPSASPSVPPSTSSPSVSPSKSPSTSSPTASPSAPTVSPTADDLAPGEEPTGSPSVSPSTSTPSVSPSTSAPSASPSVSPSTSSPSASPATSAPSMSPTSPSKSPSVSPTTLNPPPPSTSPVGPTSSPCLCQTKKGSGFKMPLPTYTCPAVASTPRPVVAPPPLSEVLSNPEVSAAVSRPVKTVTLSDITSAFVVGTPVSFTPSGGLPAVAMTATGAATATAAADGSGNQDVVVPATIDLQKVLSDIANYKLSYSLLITISLGMNLKQLKDLRFRRSGTNDIFGRKANTLQTAVDVLYSLCPSTCDGSAVGTGVAGQDDDDSAIIAVAVVVPITAIAIILAIVWYFCCGGESESAEKQTHAPYGEEPQEKPGADVEGED